MTEVDVIAQLTYQRERTHDLWADVMPLLQAHWTEVGEERLDIDVVKINMMEDIGAFRCFTVRERGKLVGYAFYVVDTSLMQKTRLIAHESGLFLVKEARRGHTCERLLKFAESSLKAEGVEEIIRQMLVSRQEVEVLFSRMGYTLHEKLYTKALKET